MKSLQKKILSALASEIDSNRFSSVSLYFTDDPQMQDINRQFRGKDKPTDVLSFANMEDPHLPSWDNSLGEIIISTDTLKRQAKKFNVSSDQELLRLLIHGTLHLLGYDHEGVSKTKAALMMRRQRTLIRQLSKELSLRNGNYFVIPSPRIKK